MSRVAKAQIIVPSNVEVHIEKENLTIKGPKGELKQHYNKLVKISKSEDKLMFEPAEKVPSAWSQAGTARAIVNNMIIGVTSGFTKALELVGVGYRAQAANNEITLSLGYSHSIKYKLPSGIKAETPTNTSIILHGIDKQKIGQVASEIRAFRSPEPYKGKGVKYVGEQIARKEAKKK